jgi:hypothetical protein
VHGDKGAVVKWLDDRAGTTKNRGGEVRAPLAKSSQFSPNKSMAGPMSQGLAVIAPMGILLWRGAEAWRKNNY